MFGLLFVLAISIWPAAAQDSAGDTFYTVSYVEVAAGSRDTAVAAFRNYEAATGAIDGYLRFELFEEPDTPEHFAVVETWRDQAAFDAGAATARQALDRRLEPIRVSNYDQRPYMALTVESAGDGDLYVVAHVDVSPNPEVPVLLSGHAAESRRDAGNVRFDVLQHTMRANHFTVIEAWENTEAYRAHVEAAHTREYRDALGPFLGSPLDERRYTPVD